MFQTVGLSILLLTTPPSSSTPAPAREAAPVEVTVYAASSLREAVGRLAPLCEKSTGTRVVLNFGSSNDLARQIDAGRKADLFLAADEAWMDTIAAKGLVDETTRRSVLSSRLVVVAPSDSHSKVARAEDLARPEVRRISLANPEAVPAGKYAKSWLDSKRLWESVRDRVIPAVDVRAALATVESGAADVGIVYKTDAAISARVRILFEVPEKEGPLISYPFAAMRGRPNLEISRRVLACLTDANARSVFERFGFAFIGGRP